MATWQHGNMATWQHGNMATWQHGNMATWQHGNILIFNDWIGLLFLIFLIIDSACSTLRYASFSSTLYSSSKTCSTMSSTYYTPAVQLAGIKGSLFGLVSCKVLISCSLAICSTALMSKLFMGYSSTSF